MNFEPSTNSSPQAYIYPSGMTKLGSQLQNPFNINTMQTAYKNLTGTGCNLEPTHWYVRFLPKNINDYMVLLDDTNFVLFDMPFNYEILSQGTHYHDPSIPIEDITWQYTTVRAGADLPDYCEVQILDELYLPDDNNQTPCKQQISIDDWEREAFSITGNLDEYDASTNGKSGGNPSIQQHRFRPEGDIFVQNTQLGNVPVRNVKVTTRRWFDIDQTFTNNNGHFRSQNTYGGRIFVALEFKNQHSKIRGIRGFRVWQIANCVDVAVGEFRGRDMEAVNFLIDNDPNDVLSDQKRLWMAAQTCNVVEEHHDFMNANNLVPPQNKLNIWLTTRITTNVTGSAPMLKQMMAPSLPLIDAFSGVLNLNGPTLSPNIIRYYLPDITFGYNTGANNPMQSDEIASLVNHELAHAAHFRQVGDVFWSVYIAYIVNNVIVSNNPPYGTINTTGVGFAEVSEGWADYIGHIATQQFYPVINGTQVNFWQRRIEGFGDRLAEFPFASGGAMYDMTDGGEEPIFTGINDEVNSYTPNQIFNAMRLDVISVPMFRDRILLQNNNRQLQQVNNLFNSYGF